MLFTYTFEFDVIHGVICLYCVPVEDMIKEVDVDGDGRIDFYGKPLPLTLTLHHLPPVVSNNRRKIWTSREKGRNSFFVPDCVPSGCLARNWSTSHWAWGERNWERRRGENAKVFHMGRDYLEPGATVRCWGEPPFRDLNHENEVSIRRQESPRFHAPSFCSCLLVKCGGFISNYSNSIFYWYHSMSFRRVFFTLRGSRNNWIRTFQIKETIILFSIQFRLGEHFLEQNGYRLSHSDHSL